MKIVAIGDLHILDSESDGYQVLNKFLSCNDTKSADTIVFLGDIFDLMIGNHHQYIDEFDHFFSQLESLLISGKEVHFIVGNHDFHLEDLFKFFLENRGLPKDKFHYHRDAFEINIGKRIYFGHGDELEYYNWKYQLYTKVIRSSLFRFIINTVPYSLIQFIGHRSSKASRKRGAKRLKIRGEKDRAVRFLETCIQFLTLSEIDILVCGHSHFEAENWNGSKCYINAGHSSRSQKYIVIEESVPRLVTLQ